MSKLFRYFATLWFIGYLPYAPGTYGSAFGFLLAAILKPDDFTLLILLPIIFILGIVTAHLSEYTLGKDSGHIVIDEFCGYLLAIMFIPKTLGFLAAAFVLFRGFDIIKPPPIRAAEKFIPGGAGVMLDDTLAALYTNICLQLWKLLIQ